MGVRVKIRLRNKKSGKVIKTSALLNSGYESKAPEVTLPRKVADILGFSPLPENAKIITVRTSGGLVSEIFVPNAAELELLDENDNVLRKITVDVSISDLENEILISDSGMDALNIEVISFSKGLWRLRGETKIRHSASPETW